MRETGDAKQSQKSLQGKVFEGQRGRMGGRKSLPEGDENVKLLFLTVDSFLLCLVFSVRVCWCVRACARDVRRAFVFLHRWVHTRPQTHTTPMLTQPHTHTLPSIKARWSPKTQRHLFMFLKLAESKCC